MRIIIKRPAVPSETLIGNYYKLHKISTRLGKQSNAIINNYHLTSDGFLTKVTLNIYII